MSVITVASYDYPPCDGGISRLVECLVKGLSARGHEVQVLTVVDSGQSGPERPDVMTTDVPRRGWRRDLAAFAALRYQSREAVLLASVWNPEGTLAWLAGRSDQLWIMAHGNEVMPYPSGLRFAWKRWLRRRVLASARGVICNSRYTERLVKAACPQARTSAIPLGVDAVRFDLAVDKTSARKHFGLPENCRVLLSVSRLNAYKGHDTVLQALAALSPAERDALCYVVAGKGEHLRALQAMATELGVAEHVHWLGYVSESDLPMLYAAADLFVLCTREDARERGVEGFGLAFLEAQAAGVPVLGTDAGGIPDAVEHGRGGWLIPQDDVSVLRRHLEKLVASPEEFEREGRIARQRAQDECNWDVYVDKLRAVVDLRGPDEGCIS